MATVILSGVEWSGTFDDHDIIGKCSISFQGYIYHTADFNYDVVLYILYNTIVCKEQHRKLYNIIKVKCLQYI